MNSAVLLRDFLRVALLAKEATGLIAVHRFSSHDATGLWHLRDARNESICEVSPDGTVVERYSEAPPPGLLDRIRDLRAFGFSSLAIYAWFGIPKRVDHLSETRVVFDIAMEHICAPVRAGKRVPVRCAPVAAD
jgi:hypothetical protein